MMSIDLDLFGCPVAPAKPVPARSRAVVSQEMKQKRLIRKLESNLLLFPDLLETLSRPIFVNAMFPAEFMSDIGNVAVPDEDVADDEEAAASVNIPYEAWGDAWITDDKDLKWSMESMLFLQIRLFWRSMEELALNNNAQEKWSVLRWIFRPAIWKYFMYNQRIGKSRCLDVHENDEPFGFHNCCIAARMDEDAVREGVRRNMPADIIKAVEAVCRFN